MNKVTIYLAAFGCTLAVPLVGYIALGIVPALIFLVGFMAGLVLWTFARNDVPFERIKVIYWVTFALFILHRIEEKFMGFFEALSKITDVPTPEITSWPVIVMVVLSVGVWLGAPYLMKKGNPLGYYFAWTFLACAGISELAHFIFPFLIGTGYNYFPGMISVLFLAPAAWYGIWLLWSSNLTNK